MRIIGRRTAQQASGQRAEDAALLYLQQRQLQLLERNFSCKVGEIDLIMRDETDGAGQSLVFVEVRQRADTRYGGAAASVTAGKQRRLIRAAQYFLCRYQHPPPCRFDVIAIDGNVTEWIRNAFDA